jgi:hypothetical protein
VKDSLVEVYVVKVSDKPVGKARVVRSEERAGNTSLYGFRFIEKTGEWILK